MEYSKREILSQAKSQIDRNSVVGRRIRIGEKGQKLNEDIALGALEEDKLDLILSPKSEWDIARIKSVIGKRLKEPNFQI